MPSRPSPSEPLARVHVTPPAAGTQWVHHCERCGERMEERQCKIVCRNCGMLRDCSDP